MRIKAYYEGQTVGTLAETPKGLVFEYAAAFLESGHQLSPFNLELRSGLHQPERWKLPGLFQDSLPDTWGERVMREWLRHQKKNPPSQLESLALLGSRGMGALTYESGGGQSQSKAISLRELHEAAGRLERTGQIELEALADTGSVAGGARPKALIALPCSGAGSILSGTGEIPATHEAWLVKFDLSPGGLTGPVEEAYALMARGAGVDVPPTRLLEMSRGRRKRRHFAVKRFDREGNRRIHHHTLAGLLHAPAGELSYETLLRVTRRLTRDEDEVLRAFRRAVFNVLAGNRDDHGKNHGFLYQNRQWRLGPAYDLTYSGGLTRGMSVGRDCFDPDVDSLRQLAANEDLDRRHSEAIIDQVRAAVDRWREYADQAGVPAAMASAIERDRVEGPAQRQKFLGVIAGG